MSIEHRRFADKETWLEARKNYIGGSDAACIMGENPWKSSTQLWREKTGREKPEDISDNPLVLYGIRAEDHLRELFRWDFFPRMQLFYDPNVMWLNTEYPWAEASLDGWLLDADGRQGILEIKTATINGPAQKAKWQDRIPQNYYIQLLHYFMVTELDFAILKAQLKYEIKGENLYIQTKHYHFNRAEVEEDLETLIKEERKFAQAIKEDITPALVLPMI